MNSFKLLDDENQRLFLERSDRRVRQKIDDSMGIYRLFGSIMNMYVPTLASTVVTFLDSSKPLAGSNDPRAPIKSTTPPVPRKESDSEGRTDPDKL
ncbi:MAG: hypothetical protein WBA17_13180 [Saprospiraceae bacterium]